MPSTKHRARLRALLGRLTMAAVGVSTTAAVPGDLPSISRRGDDVASADDADDATDTDVANRAARAHNLAVALAHLAPIEATRTACEWALAPQMERRLAVAAALEWAFPLVGDDLLIDHLARDDEAVIRAAAARAAWARRAAGGDPGVLARLVSDPDPHVREVATLAVRG